MARRFKAPSESMEAAEATTTPATAAAVTGAADTSDILISPATLRR